MKDEVSLAVPGAPQGKARARMTRNGHAYTPEKTRAYEARIADAASKAMEGRRSFEGPVCLYLCAYYPVPQSWSESKKRRAINGDISPTVKPDLDNVLKAFADGCNGIIYRDDAQIVHAVTEKKYSAIPGVNLTVLPWLHDSTSPDPSNVIWRDSVIRKARAA